MRNTEIWREMGIKVDKISRSFHTCRGCPTHDLCSFLLECQKSAPVPSLAELADMVKFKPKPTEQPDESLTKRGARRKKGGTRDKRGFASYTYSLKRRCGVPGCDRRISDQSKAGVCRNHNHAMDRCVCDACEKKRLPKDRGHCRYGNEPTDDGICTCPVCNKANRRT